MNEEKSSKQKCIEMWEWLRDNPGKDKDDYKYYLILDNREHEYAECWACEEDVKLASLDNYTFGFCHYCPVTWTKEYNRRCLHLDSPYAAWLINKSAKNAQAVIDTIITTWKEE